MSAKGTVYQGLFETNREKGVLNTQSSFNSITNFHSSLSRTEWGVLSADPEKRIQKSGPRKAVPDLWIQISDRETRIQTRGYRLADYDKRIYRLENSKHRIQICGFSSADASGSRLADPDKVIQTSGSRSADPAPADPVQWIQPLIQFSGLRSAD